MTKQWDIICDFDGTIALQDTTDLVLSTYAHPDWEKIEQEWKQGKIGSAECMRQQVELIDANMVQLNALLDTVEIDPHFADFVDWCVGRGVRLLIASDGVDYFIQRILARHDLAHLPVRANVLTLNDQGLFTLEFPHAKTGCSSGHCKCTLAASPKSHCILIGDGQSDFCLAGEADFVIAKKRLLDYCREQNLPHAGFENFAEVRAMLSQLIAAPAAQPAMPELIAL